ncbi:MAG: DNA mismatch repair endonuclease MutL [Armatimonadota bacterium]
MADVKLLSIVKVLDDVTANKIAAGEVVERPASALKELIENSIDAKACEIKIELAEGGRKLIRVTDNGMGMSRDDAVLALQRHATSKIKSADDLFAIHTLGFRGEALPSIASVSRMEILTRRECDDYGTIVTCAGGEMQEVSDAGSPVGTSITVTDLFYNVPARQKFLKTIQTELGHIVELVNRYAISHYDIDITLVHNDRTIFKSVRSDRLQDAILTVFGRDAAEEVIPILGRSGPYKIHGYVSRPSYSKTSRSGQMFFVNRRFVRNRNLIHALDDSYRGILNQGRYPLFVGFIEVDPELVDVNVHPTKIEVKFVKEWEVHNLLSTSVKEALASSAVSPDGFDSFQPAAQQVQRPPFARPDYASDRAPASTPLELDSFRQALSTRIDQNTSVDPFADPIANVPSTVHVHPEPISGSGNDLLSGAVVLAQARNMYIVAQSPKGLILIDQHVAHERILFDQLSSIGNGVSVQRLIMPLTLELSKREALVVENKLSDLRSLGFDLETFGKDAFVLRTVPALIAEKNYEQILRDTIEELTELTVTRRLMVHKEAVITTTACKMAVKAGDRLSFEEMIRLVSELAHTSNPYLCPHGRPIVICISNRELDKMFGRS